MDTTLVLDEDGIKEMAQLTSGDQPQPASTDPSWAVGLACEAIEAARQAAGRIRARHRGMVEGILDTGQDLIAIKSKLGHGKFGAWVEASVGWSARTAENYMRVAEEFGDNRELVTQLSPTTLYGLAAKSTPLHVRQGVIDEIKGGSALNSKSVKERIRAAKQAKTSRGRDGGCKARSADRTSNVPTKECKQSKAPSGKTVNPDAELFREAAKRAVGILQRRLAPDFEKFARALQKIPPAAFLAALYDATGGETVDASKGDGAS
ncbi:DUF3102 domain-containing protein [Chelativorans sp. ZYF759]|uniref:DUF3102 domain-containing protein n=1 Tax=Chelativorans sp. ZYF759 TaxID=2692213 RepID=UPI00145C8F99|nr:DUF3102 domain-containing protein [Chelativorans sp. ZYF759]NMG41995.1 DUF3102 domain-containing protein [Chelativorans sp. ZYF759]